MKIKNSFKIIGAVFLTLSLAACGSSSSSSSSSGNTTTLGVTSLAKGTSAKPSLAKNFFGKALNIFSVREAIANNTGGLCQDPTSSTFLKITDATVSADMIWITKAYAILDEFQFEDVSSSSSDSIDDNIQWAIDLLNNDNNVVSQVTLTVPTGLVANAIKFKVQRLEDDQLSLLKGVTNQTTFLNDIGFNDGDGKRVRPSVFLKGDILAGGVCHTFRFITDGRFRTRVPFASGSTFDTASVKGVLQFDIIQAFKDSGVSVLALAGELGAQKGNSKDLPTGADYLDGRLKDTVDTGSTNAVLWARALMPAWEVFTQSLTSTSTLDDSATQLTVDDPNSTDDNPSASDVDNPQA